MIINKIKNVNGFMQDLEEHGYTYMVSMSDFEEMYKTGSAYVRYNTNGTISVLVKMGTELYFNFIFKRISQPPIEPENKPVEYHKTKYQRKGY